MKKILLNTGILTFSLFVLGCTNAQETEVEKVPPVSSEEEEISTTMPETENGYSQEDFESDSFEDSDVEAQFPGGRDALNLFIRENVQYPEEARKNKEEGRVYASFIVDSEGVISNIEIMRGPDSPSLNQEVIRLIKSMPNWTPGTVKGQPTSTKCRLPITFVL